MRLPTRARFVLCQSQSDWANYGALYSRGVKRTRGCFANDVVTDVHIRLNPPASRRKKQPALHAATEIGFALLNRLQVEEGAFGGVAFFTHHHTNAEQSRFVGQQLNKSRMRDGHEVLIGAPS